MAGVLGRAPEGWRLTEGSIQGVLDRKNLQGVREAEQEQGGALR